jgi:hypothetical protein
MKRDKSGQIVQLIVAQIYTIKTCNYSAYLEIHAFLLSFKSPFAKGEALFAEGF